MSVTRFDKIIGELRIAALPHVPPLIEWIAAESKRITDAIKLDMKAIMAAMDEMKDALSRDDDAVVAQSERLRIISDSYKSGHLCHFVLPAKIDPPYELRDQVTWPKGPCEFVIRLTEAQAKRLSHRRSDTVFSAMISNWKKDGVEARLVATIDDVDLTTNFSGDPQVLNGTSVQNGEELEAMVYGGLTRKRAPR